MITVLHSHPTWLQPTQNWMYHLVKSLPDDIDSRVSCIRTKNLDQFPVETIYCSENESPFRARMNAITGRLRIPVRFDFLARHITRSRADIVHSHFGNVGAVDSATVARSGAKHVVTFYGFDVGRLPRIQPSILNSYRHMFDRVSTVLCEGSHMGRDVEKLGCPAEKIVVQHLGVDLKRFQFRPRFWSPGTPLKVLIAASFREKKGIPFALEGLANLSGKIPLEITVIGDAARQGPTQVEKMKIMKVVEDRGIQSLVHWLGYQSHEKMLETAYEHHLFVSTSVTASDGDSEGGAPVSIIEMAATGMPVVSSLHCDIPEVILNGQTGWLAEERNVESITRQLELATSQSANWPSICRAGRDHLEKHYDLFQQGTKLADIYQRLVT